MSEIKVKSYKRKNRWDGVPEEVRKEASRKMHTKRWLNKTKKERMAHIQMMIEAKKSYQQKRLALDEASDKIK